MNWEKAAPVIAVFGIIAVLLVVTQIGLNQANIDLGTVFGGDRIAVVEGGNGFTVSLDEEDIPADEECATFEGDTDNIEWQVCSSGGVGSALTDDNIWLGSSGGTAAEEAIPDCIDSAGNHLNYTVSSNTFSCGATAPTITSTGSVVFEARKASAGTITKGSPVYLQAFNPSGWIEVEEADADVPTEMPVIGLAAVDLTNSSTGTVILSGELTGLDTTGFSVLDELYVSTTPGVLTATKPVGNSAAIQKVAQVARAHLSQGVLEVFGAGRPNDVPNIADDSVWVGSATDVATQAAVGDCDDSGGNHLNYDTATNAFSCGTSSSIGGENLSTTLSIGNTTAGVDIVFSGAGDTIDFTRTQTLRIDALAQTVGLGTAQVPDLASTTDQFVFEDVAAILTGKTIAGASNTLTIRLDDLDTQGSKTDEWCLTVETTAGAEIELQACGGGGADLATVLGIGNTTGGNNIVMSGAGDTLNYTRTQTLVIDALTQTTGTGTAQVPDLAGTTDQFVLEDVSATLTSKSLTSPTITGSPTAVGATWADLGTVTTIDIDGGSGDFATLIGDSLGIDDDGSAFVLSIDENETLTGNRILFLVVNNTDRTIDLTGDLTVESASLVDQDLTEDATGVAFASLSVTGSNSPLTIGATDGEIFFTGTTFGVAVEAVDQTVGGSIAQIPNLASTTDQFVFEDVSQILTNKTISGASNTLTIRLDDLDTQGTKTDELCLTVETTSGAEIEIQSCGGGSADLATVLSIGNVTNGNDIVMSGSGDTLNFTRTLTLVVDALTQTTGTGTAQIIDLGGATDQFVFEDTSQVLTSKSLTSPVITGSPTAVGATWVDLGSTNTIDVNGGTIDNATLGAADPVTLQGLDLDTLVAGDVLYASGADTLARLAIGSDDEVLTLASGIPSWATPAGGAPSLTDADRQDRWVQYYHQRFDIIGFDAITMVPIGDPKHGALSGSTISGRREHASGIETTWTSARTQSTMGVTGLGPSEVPTLTFNGTSDRFTTTSNSLYAPGNGTTDDPWSVIIWVKPNGVPDSRDLLIGKWAGSQRSWSLGFTDTGSDRALRFRLLDESLNGSRGRETGNNVITDGNWYQIIVSYGGNESSPEGDIDIHVNNVVKDTTDYNTGSYNANEVTTSSPSLMYNAEEALYYPGDVAGGPMGPVIFAGVLTAAQRVNLYRLGVAALGF